MAAADKQVQIDFIVSELKLGNSRAKILAKVGKKWQTATRTFDAYFKKAKVAHQQQQDIIKSKVLEVEIEGAVEARKLEIMDSNQRKQLLSDIARGGKKTFDADRIRAIAELNKMEGDYATTKTETTIKVEPITGMEVK